MTSSRNFDLETEIETSENHQGDQTIENPDDFRDEVNEVDASMTPDGSEVSFEVDNPNKRGAPRFLRVSGHRKGEWYKMIPLAKAWGLEVTDVWQGNADKESDLIFVKLVPREAADE